MAVHAIDVSYDVQAVLADVFVRHVQDPDPTTEGISLYETSPGLLGEVGGDPLAMALNIEVGQRESLPGEFAEAKGGWDGDPGVAVAVDDRGLGKDLEHRLEVPEVRR